MIYKEMVATKKSKVLAENRWNENADMVEENLAQLRQLYVMKMIIYRR